MFLVKCNRVTVTINCVIAEKHLYFNLLVTKQIIVGYNLTFVRSLTASYLEMDG